jgi:hypothetical protein
MAIFDKSLHFGMQNFLYCAKDESTDATYNYYGYMNKKGAILILRTDKNADNGLYYITIGDFATVFAFPAIQGYTYDYPSNLLDPEL